MLFFIIYPKSFDKAGSKEWILPAGLTHLHLRGPGNGQSEGTSLDVLVIQAESQGEVSLFGYCVYKLIGSVLVVYYFTINDASVRGEHLLDHMG